MQLRGDTDEAEKGIAEASGSDSEEDDEGRRLFALLKALNPMVEERIYFKFPPSPCPMPDLWQMHAVGVRDTACCAGRENGGLTR